MAAIDLGTGGSRRETNRELPLVPFIDFLLCLIAFLLVTAVWTKMSRLPVDAPHGKMDCCAPDEKPKTLHVKVEDERFVLSWREGPTLLSSRDIARKSRQNAAGDARFPELAKALDEEWKTNGMHRAPSDPNRDAAVLHAPNSLRYAELVGVMDAVRAVRRGSPDSDDSAFVVSFAMD